MREQLGVWGRGIQAEGMGHAKLLGLGQHEPEQRSHRGTLQVTVNTLALTRRDSGAEAEWKLPLLSQHPSAYWAGWTEADLVTAGGRASRARCWAGPSHLLHQGRPSRPHNVGFPSLWNSSELEKSAFPKDFITFQLGVAPLTLPHYPLPPWLPRLSVKP